MVGTRRGLVLLGQAAAAAEVGHRLKGVSKGAGQECLLRPGRTLLRRRSDAPQAEPRNAAQLRWSVGNQCAQGHCAPGRGAARLPAEIGPYQPGGQVMWRPPSIWQCKWGTASPASGPLLNTRR